MTEFLAAQSADPHDPAPMLIQADWLEERGDLAGAAALRGLAEWGYASTVALAWMLAAEPPPAAPLSDESRCEARPPLDFAIGFGAGDEFGERGGWGHGEPDGLEGGMGMLLGCGEGRMGIDASELFD